MILSPYLTTVFKDLLRTKDDLGDTRTPYGSMVQIEWLQYIGNGQAWIMTLVDGEWEQMEQVELVAIPGNSLTTGKWYLARGYGETFACEGDTNCQDDYIELETTGLAAVIDDYVQVVGYLASKPSNVISDTVQCLVSLTD